MKQTIDVTHGPTNENFHVSHYKYVPFSAILNSEFVVYDRETILKNTNNAPFWLDFTHEPWAQDTEHRIKQELLTKNITNFYILTGNNNYFYTPDSEKYIIYQPQHFLESRFNKYLAPILPRSLVENSERTHLMSCYNGRARVHRIENYILLKENPNFNKIKFSMHNKLNESQEEVEPPGLLSIDPQLLEKWYAVCNTLPKTYNDSDWSGADDAYSDTYVAFVTETVVNDTYWFLSEKIWRPVMAGQFFILLGYPNTIKYMRDIGIDVFDDIINHSYDLEPDWHKRIQMLHKEIDRIMTLDLPSLFKQTTERRIRNYNYFYSKEMFELCTAHLPRDSLKVDINLVDFHVIQ